MRQLKLIWDFRGPDGRKIAEHHEIHLKEYIQINQLKVYKTGVEELSDRHAIAFMVIDETDMKPVRDRLKPHRGTYYSS